MIHNFSILTVKNTEKNNNNEVSWLRTEGAALQITRASEYQNSEQYGDHEWAPVMRISVTTSLIKK